MIRRPLPIGIQTFREIREGDYYYVDKTGFALRLIAEGKSYFLSRPRRFGKSLFRFAFLTGVSKFSKVSLFSGLNNLSDITVDARWSALCGYTKADLDQVFAPELEGLDREQIRAWYNGYNWLGEAVYNPFDVLLLFNAREFRPWWFETGTPTRLVDVLTERGYFTPDLAAVRASEALLSAFDVDHLAPEALLWQTGYLTFTGSRQIGARREYSLGYANLEVEKERTLVRFEVETVMP